MSSSKRHAWRGQQINLGDAQALSNQPWLKRL
jgi:hypothetical protein